MMSPGLEDILDVDNMYDEVGVDEASSDDVAPETTRDVQGHSGFKCGVTLLDDEERSGDVLSFTRRRSGSRTVSCVCTQRIADDISTGDITRIRVISPTGLDVWDVEFDVVNDPSDIPDIGYELTQWGVVVTLSMDLGDSYTPEEDS